MHDRQPLAHPCTQGMHVPVLVSGPEHGSMGAGRQVNVLVASPGLHEVIV